MRVCPDCARRHSGLGGGIGQASNHERNHVAHHGVRVAGRDNIALDEDFQHVVAGTTVEGGSFACTGDDQISARRASIIGGGSGYSLAAIEQVTTLTGSVFLALALAERRLAADDVWRAAHVDEDWNAELWGMDDEAVERRAFRRSEYDAALVALGLR